MRQKLRDMRVGLKILLVILVMSLGTLLGISITSYLSMMGMAQDFQLANITMGLTASDGSKEALEKQAEEYLLKITQRQTLASNEKLVQVRQTVAAAADYLTALYANPQNFQGRDLPLPDQTEAGVASSKYMLAPDVVSTEEIQQEVRLISNAEYQFAPFLAENPMLDNLYAGTKTGVSYRYSRANSYDPTYDPRARGWYTAAMESPDQTVWLDTYLDSFGNTAITCASTFRGADGEIAGVVASDIALQDMLDEIVSVKIGTTGFAAVLDKDMEFIAHPDFFQEGFSVQAADHLEGDTTAVLKLFTENDTGITRFMLDGKESDVAFARMEETGWKLCISIDAAEVIAPALATKDSIDAITENTQQGIQNTLSQVMLRYIIFFAIMGIVVILLSFSVAGTVTRPIQNLARSVAVIGQGEFDKPVVVESADEVGKLAESFNEMLLNLQHYVQDLTAMTAEKERISAELGVANHIQASMLPSIFPPFPNRTEFDLFASMHPAKEVGGDFYDFFLVDEDHLALVIADVSGKGVPAALFMVVAKTLLKNQAQTGDSPKAILEKVNQKLCENNEAEMFVTVWLGIYEISTGKIVAANAGHEYPTLKQKNSTFQLVKDKHGFVLAGMENLRYKEYELELQKGDTLFVYTDGVAEATNGQSELFGTERMLDSLNAMGDASPKDLLHQMQKDIDLFVGNAPQFDDITMLCITRRK